MTAPDDLARTLAEALPFDVDSRAEGYYFERWSAAEALVAVIERIQEWDYEDDAHNYCHERGPLVVLLTHLASVVSRRDADLRTRIEELIAEAEPMVTVTEFEDRETVAPPVLCVAVADLSRALDGDTREGAQPADTPLQPGLYIDGRGRICELREVGGTWQHPWTTTEPQCLTYPPDRLVRVARSRRPADTDTRSGP